MLTASRSLRRNIKSAPELPRVPELDDLRNFPFHFRHGEVIMVAGRSGAGKSTFVEWLVDQMNLPTLYLSADMTPYEASVRLACSRLRMTADQIDAEVSKGGGGAERVLSALNDSRITFAFGEITWRGIEAQLEAYVEAWNAYPEIIVVDNLMDIENCEGDYHAQQQAMSWLTEISREIDCTMFILHHATDKSQEARQEPGRPPARHDIKNGLAEKPQSVLTVALSPYSDEFNIAVVKQRMGRQDQTAFQYVTIKAIPAEARYEKHGSSSAATRFLQ